MITLRRLRRWWVLRCMHARMAQLSLLIDAREAQIVERRNELAELHVERAALRNRVALATAPRCTGRPFTWGL